MINPQDERDRAIPGLSADDLAPSSPELDDIGDTLTENDDGSVTITDEECDEP